MRHFTLLMIVSVKCTVLFLKQRAGLQGCLLVKPNSADDSADGKEAQLPVWSLWIESKMCTSASVALFQMPLTLQQCHLHGDPALFGPAEE